VVPIARPELKGHKADRATGAVLIVHGGAARGSLRMRWTMSPVLRMAFFAPDLILATGGDASVVRLKNRFLGWNGDDQAPLADARWALDVIRDAHPGVPIVLVGHSLGGRVVLHLADEPDVVAVAALGPWIETDDPVVGHPGERFLLVHSRKDRITDPRQTQRYAAELTARGAHVDLRLVRDLHAMLLRPGRWHRAVARFAAAAIRDANSADRPN
jgi:dienelactone hydrolase